MLACRAETLKAGGEIKGFETHKNLKVNSGRLSVPGPVAAGSIVPCVEAD